MSTVVFLGGGRITSAMLAGLRLARRDIAWSCMIAIRASFVISRSGTRSRSSQT